MPPDGTPGAGRGERPAATARRPDEDPVISSAARRWSELWSELDLSQARVLGEGLRVRAERRGPPVEIAPMLFDLHGGRRFISVGVRPLSGEHAEPRAGDPAFVQLLNLPFTDWSIADQLWDLLDTGDMGVSFQGLEGIHGGHGKAAKAADRLERDRWIQSVWELKLRLEAHAQERTTRALGRVAEEVRALLATASELWGEGVTMPAVVMEPEATREAVTRFRINQGLYGDHTLFIDRPEGGVIRVHGIPPDRMFERAAELERELVPGWLSVMDRELQELVALTRDRHGPALSRAIQSAQVAHRLNAVVGTFWEMWRNPVFSANAEFEVVRDHERRARKYMDIMVQRTLRVLLKQAVEAIGLYPYDTLDAANYGTKVHNLREALARARRILDLYAQARTIPAFHDAFRERDRLVREFQALVRQGEGRLASPPGQL